MPDQPSFADMAYDAVVMPSRVLPHHDGEPYTHWSRRAVERQLDAAYQRGLAEGRTQATEGWEREWAYESLAGIAFPVADGDDLLRVRANIATRAADGTLLARLVGPWEPAEPEHAFDPASVVNPATGEPYRGSSGPVPYEPPDPLCVCGCPWLDEGCVTQQPGWTPPAPYDGPSLEELLPAEQTEVARCAACGDAKPGPFCAAQPGCAHRSAEQASVVHVPQLPDPLDDAGDYLPQPGPEAVAAKVRAAYGLTGPAAGGVVEPSSPPTAEEAALNDIPPGYALVDAEGRCGCCYGTGEHRCGSECYSCDGSGKDPDSPVCTVPHGPDCRCSTRAVPPAPVRRQHDPGALTEEPDLYEREGGAR